MNKYKFFAAVLFCIFSICVLAQEEEEAFDDDDVNASAPIPETYIEILSCDESKATIRICNDGVEKDPNYKGFAMVFGFTRANLVEAPLKEDVVIEPNQDGELEYIPRETPVDRMETEFLGKYVAPKNILFNSDTREILPDQCIDVTFDNGLGSDDDFVQKVFSCDTPIVVTLGVDTGDLITHVIDFQNMEEKQ